MRCASRKALQAFLDGELPEMTAKELKDHLAGCRTCRDAAVGMKSDKDLARETLRRLDPAGVPMPALGHDGAPATYARPIHVRRPLAVILLQSPAAALLMAALFLTGLFLGIFLRGGAPSGGGLEGTKTPATLYFSGGNAVRAVSLDLDGYRPLAEPRVILITEERQ